MKTVNYWIVESTAIYWQQIQERNVSMYQFDQLCPVEGKKIQRFIYRCKWISKENGRVKRGKDLNWFLLFCIHTIIWIIA